MPSLKTELKGFFDEISEATNSYLLTSFDSNVIQLKRYLSSFIFVLPCLIAQSSVYLNVLYYSLDRILFYAQLYFYADRGFSSWDVLYCIRLLLWCLYFETGKHSSMLARFHLKKYEVFSYNINVSEKLRWLPTYIQHEHINRYSIMYVVSSFCEKYCQAIILIFLFFYLSCSYFYLDHCFSNI